MGQGDEWTVDAGLTLALSPSLSATATVALSAAGDLAEPSALLNTTMAWQPNDALSITSSIGQGMRDTAFEQDERLALVGLALSL